MKDLSLSPLFSNHNESLSLIVEMLGEAKMIQLVTSADIESVLALCQLESAFLDRNLPYRRRVLPAIRHIPRDSIDAIPDSEGLVIHIDSFHETMDSLDLSGNRIHIHPVSCEVKFGSSQNVHHGALDCVSICGALAELLAPEGTRVRKQRPLLISGAWLRQGIEANYDPVLSKLRDHLDSEGSILVCPLPEVPSPAKGMIPGLSERMLKRLSSGWSGMDVSERASAISELVLPTLGEDGLSTMRLEELVWHRAMIPGQDVDIASQLYLAANEWPDGEDESRVHASSIADTLIKNGHF